MTSVLPYHYTHEIPSQVEAKYSGCLKVLGGPEDKKGTQPCFEDAAACHVMTICQVSTFLCREHALIISKSWLGQAGNKSQSHRQIIACFMGTVTEKGWSSIFELKLLESSLIALFFEALVDPRIDLEQYVNGLSSHSRQNAYEYNQDPPVRSFQAQRLVRIPRLLHEPLEYVEEIKATYRELRDDHARIQHHLDSVQEQRDPSESLQCRQKFIHRLQVTEAFLLTAALALNRILRAAYPDEGVLFLEASTLANELIILAKAAYDLRPLGASYIPPCLAAVVSHSPASPNFCISEVTDHLSSGQRRVLWKPRTMRLRRCSRNISLIMFA